MSIDIELDTEDPQAIIDAVTLMEPDVRRHQPRGHQGARVLHHRAGAEASASKIPVIHDDQHGTAIISAAGLLNACFIAGQQHRAT
jgi:malate dehydrogenase (oxaloacetate-decarboxylating)(NADP+)